MHFGFSYVGIIFLLMLFIPNGIWAKNIPENYEEYSRNENKFLLILERIGEVLVRRNRYGGLCPDGWRKI